jgi:hypothetical protein
MFAILHWKKSMNYLILAVPCTGIPLLCMYGVIWLRDWQNKSQNLRPPTTDKMVRPPGESLRRKLEVLDGSLAGILIAFMMVAMLSYIILSTGTDDRHPYPRLGMILQAATLLVVSLSYLTFKLHRLMRDMGNNNLGFKGERFVGQALNELMLDGCFVYHDFPAEKSWNIDHIIIAPSGVYAVETKTRRKRGSSKDNRVVFDGEKIHFPGWADDYGLQQATDNARWLYQFLSSATGEKIWVTPILTFPGWWVDRKAPTDSLAVLNPKEIRKYVVEHQIEQKCKDVEF